MNLFSIPRRTLSFGLILAFIFNALGPLPLAQAATVPGQLPKPGVMVPLSQRLNPPILKGIKVHPDNPFKFDFILDKGDSTDSKRDYTDSQLRQESSRLIKYFLASLTIPEDDLWVNLSPYEKDRIIPNSFGLTEMGRDLLAQDYMLKQITASLIYPEDELGKKFWKRIYEEAQSKYGTTNIPVNTFNKVWIVPEKAVVYENSAKNGAAIDGAGHTAYVVESRLKVMLEADYMSLEKHSGKPVVSDQWSVISEKHPKNNPLTTDHRALITEQNNLGSQIVREIVIPALTREVNEGANFAQLRQVYNSLILATWYKKKIKDSILAQVYADKNKIAGTEYEASVVAPQTTRGHVQSRTTKNVSPSTLPSDRALNVKAPQGNQPNEVEAIYRQYLQAFKKGVYNYIKEEADPSTGQPIPRKYFSGGMLLNLNTHLAANAAMRVVTSPVGIDANQASLARIEADFAMASNEPEASIAGGSLLGQQKLEAHFKSGLPPGTVSLLAFEGGSPSEDPKIQLINHLKANLAPEHHYLIRDIVTFLDAQEKASKRISFLSPNLANIQRSIGHNDKLFNVNSMGFAQGIRREFGLATEEQAHRVALVGILLLRIGYGELENGSYTIDEQKAMYWDNRKYALAKLAELEAGGLYTILGLNSDDQKNKFREAIQRAGTYGRGPEYFGEEGQRASKYKNPLTALLTMATEMDISRSRLQRWQKNQSIMDAMFNVLFDPEVRNLYIERTKLELQKLDEETPEIGSAITQNKEEFNKAVAQQIEKKILKRKNVIIEQMVRREGITRVEAEEVFEEMKRSIGAINSETYLWVISSYFIKDVRVSESGEIILEYFVDQIPSLGAAINLEHIRRFHIERLEAIFNEIKDVSGANITFRDVGVRENQKMFDFIQNEAGKGLEFHADQHAHANMSVASESVFNTILGEGITIEDRDEMVRRSEKRLLEMQLQERFSKKELSSKEEAEKQIRNYLLKVNAVAAVEDNEEMLANVRLYFKQRDGTPSRDEVVLESLVQDYDETYFISRKGLPSLVRDMDWTLLQLQKIVREITPEQFPNRQAMVEEGRSALRKLVLQNGRKNADEIKREKKLRKLIELYDRLRTEIKDIYNFRQGALTSFVPHYVATSSLIESRGAKDTVSSLIKDAKGLEYYELRLSLSPDAVKTQSKILSFLREVESNRETAKKAGLTIPEIVLISSITKLDDPGVSTGTRIIERNKSVQALLAFKEQVVKNVTAGRLLDEEYTDSTGQVPLEGKGVTNRMIINAGLHLDAAGQEEFNEPELLFDAYKMFDEKMDKLNQELEAYYETKGAPQSDRVTFYKGRTYHIAESIEDITPEGGMYNVLRVMFMNDIRPEFKWAEAKLYLERLGHCLVPWLTDYDQFKGKYITERISERIKNIDTAISLLEKGVPLLNPTNERVSQEGVYDKDYLIRKLVDERRSLMGQTGEVTLFYDDARVQDLKTIAGFIRDQIIRHQVVVETNPTSNVGISKFIPNFESHTVKTLLAYRYGGWIRSQLKVTLTGSQTRYYYYGREIPAELGKRLQAAQEIDPKLRNRARFTINTDDKTSMDTSLQEELYRIAKALGLSEGEVAEIVHEGFLSRFSNQPLRNQKKIEEQHIRYTLDRPKEGLEEMLAVLPDSIGVQLENAFDGFGMSAARKEREIAAAKTIITKLELVYRTFMMSEDQSGTQSQRELLIDNYHNFLHNLMVTFAALKLTENADLIRDEKDLKVTFLAALLHDFHVRFISVKGEDSDTKALVEETIFQLEDLLLGLGYNQKRNKRNQTAYDLKLKDDQGFKSGIRAAVKEFLGSVSGSEDFKNKVWPEIKAMILRTDFPSDVPEGYIAQDSKIKNEARSYFEMEVEKTRADGRFIRERIIEGVKDIYRRRIDDVRAIVLPPEDQVEEHAKAKTKKENSLLWLNRQMSIEINFLTGLLFVSSDRRMQVFHLANRLEISDQSGAGWIGTEREADAITLGLKKEVPAVGLEGSYMFFYKGNILNPAALYILKDLPLDAKRNFFKNMEYYAHLTPTGTADWEGSSEKHGFKNEVLVGLGLYMDHKGRIYSLSDKKDIREIMLTLLHSTFGNSFSLEELHMLANHPSVYIEKYETAKNPVVLQQGAAETDALANTDLWAVAEGLAEVEHDGVVVATREAGELIGEIGAIRAQPRSGSVRIASGYDFLRLLRIPRGLFHGLFLTNENFRRKVVEIIKQRLSNSNLDGTVRNSLFTKADPPNGEALVETLLARGVLERAPSFPNDPDPARVRLKREGKTQIPLPPEMIGNPELEHIWKLLHEVVDEKRYVPVVMKLSLGTDNKWQESVDTKSIDKPELDAYTGKMDSIYRGVMGYLKEKNDSLKYPVEVPQFKMITITQKGPVMSIYQDPLDGKLVLALSDKFFEGSEEEIVQRMGWALYHQLHYIFAKIPKTVDRQDQIMEESILLLRDLVIDQSHSEGESNATNQVLQGLQNIVFFIERTQDDEVLNQTLKGLRNSYLPFIVSGKKINIAVINGLLESLFGAKLLEDENFRRSYLLRLKERGITVADAAMDSVPNPTGGIDFNPSQMNLQTKNEGGPIRFTINPELMKQLQNAPGLKPRIITIEPLKDLMQFLGV